MNHTKLSYWKPNTSSSGLIECLEKASKGPERGVFAQDVHVSGAKKFFVCGYVYFCDKFYKRLPESAKCIYEVLTEDASSKVYIDYDASRNDIETSQKFNETLEKLTTFIKSNCDSPDRVNRVVLGADSDKKFSRHVIFNVVYSNITAVKTVIEAFLASADHNDPDIDMGVYTKNRCFRLMGSRKKGSDRVLIPAGSQKSYKICQTLIQYIQPDSTVRGKPISNFGNSDNSKGKRKRESAAQLDDLEYLKQWLDRRDLKVVNIQTKTFKNAQGTKVPTLDLTLCGDAAICGWTKRVHKSNNLFASLDKRNGRLSFRCSDPDCPMAPFRVIQSNRFIG